MNSIRKILSIVGLVLTSFAAACSQGASREVVLLLLKTTDNPFFQAIQRGAADELSKSGLQLDLLVRSGTREGDVSAQRQALEAAYIQFITQQRRPLLKGVLLTPAGSRGELVSEIAKLRNAGVPVILLDTNISQEALASESTDVSTYIGSDNHRGGQQAAEFLAKIPNLRRILLLNGVDGQETAAARRAGFVTSAVAHSWEVTERTCNWRRDEARLTVAALLARGQEFDAIFAANDEMAIGAADALAASARASKPIVGFDGTPEARARLAAGTMTATIAQDPEGMARAGIRSLLSLLQGTSVPREQSVALQLLVSERP
jgi:ABC-type sugar transport system substrate-binding protein